MLGLMVKKSNAFGILNFDTVSVCTACEINVKKRYACIYLIIIKKGFIL